MNTNIVTAFFLGLFIGMWIAFSIAAHEIHKTAAELHGTYEQILKEIER